MQNKFSQISFFDIVKVKSGPEIIVLGRTKNNNFWRLLHVVTDTFLYYIGCIFSLLCDNAVDEAYHLICNCIKFLSSKE